MNWWNWVPGLDWTVEILQGEAVGSQSLVHQSPFNTTTPSTTPSATRNDGDRAMSMANEHRWWEDIARGLGQGPPRSVSLLCPRHRTNLSIVTCHITHVWVLAKGSQETRERMWTNQCTSLTTYRRNNSKGIPRRWWSWMAESQAATNGVLKSVPNSEVKHYKFWISSHTCQKPWCRNCYL